MTTLDDMYIAYGKNLALVKANQPSYYDCERALDLVERKIKDADDFDPYAARVFSTLVDLIAIYTEEKQGPRWDNLSVRVTHIAAIGLSNHVYEMERAR